jgi:hypothetical protein
MPRCSRTLRCQGALIRCPDAHHVVDMQGRNLSLWKTVEQEGKGAGGVFSARPEEEC